MNRWEKQKINSNMGDLNSVVSIITVYVKSLNNPVKMQRFSEWIKSKTPLYIIYKKLILNNKTHN